MTIWWLVLIVGSLATAFGGFVWIALKLNHLQGGPGGQVQKSKADLDRAYTDIAEEDASHLFNKEFREELRNRGRLRFEKIIEENATFMKQDLDATISQLNDYMKDQIAAKLDVEFVAYTKAMKEAQELALGTLRKTAEEIETQRQQLATAMKADVSQREEALLKVYEENMAKIVEHYVLQALGDQIDLKSQLPYIIAQMESNKEAIMEDMRL
ncbi:MAG TPA: hypothetical protein VLF59_03910 [Candidatus Saccharimonadales bacterium]|nr:hypothetical protein [Candidatus Saccharimonadales bacterium]